MHLWCMALLVMIFTLIMAGMSIYNSIQAFNRAMTNLADIQGFSFVFMAASFISAERGPANILMSVDDASRDQAYENWQIALQKTDAALSKLDTSSVPRNLLKDVREQLRLGRMKVEAAQFTNPGTLRYGEIHEAIVHLFQARESYDKIVQQQGTELLRHDEDLAAVVFRVTMLSNLREYAGRLGSYLIAPMAVRKPIPAENVIHMRIIGGRIREIWHLLELGRKPDVEASSDDQKHEEANSRYMIGGLALIDHQIRTAQQNGVPALDAVTFTKQYSAAMKPLAELRDIYFAASVAKFEKRERIARQALYYTSAMAFVILGLVVGLVVVQNYIFKPLFRGAEAIVSLADDLPTDLHRETRHVAEIQTLYSALEVIAIKLKERSFLVARLEHLAHTDGLTGLLNRRALDILGNSATENYTDLESIPFLMLVDIDNFKTINDKYGHVLGDEVLREIAQLMQNNICDSDYVARFGGEEFAILLNDSSCMDAAIIAQKLRLAVERLAMTTSDGSVLKITASFGVAQVGDQSWSETVNQADLALYQAKKAGRNRVRFADQVADALEQYSGAEIEAVRHS